MVPFSRQSVVGAVAGVVLGAGVASLGSVRAGERVLVKSKTIYLSTSERDAVAAVVAKSLDPGEIPERVGCVLLREDGAAGELFECIVSVQKIIQSVNDIGDGAAYIKEVPKVKNGEGSANARANGGDR